MPTKSCIVCGEQIQLVATRCPHCHQVQNRFYQFFNTAWGAVIFLLVVGLGIAYGVTREPINWTYHASTIKASEVKLRASNSARGTEMACIALLKNDGTRSWKEPVIEASFFGQDGQLIDTATQRFSEVIIRRGGEARIRVREQGAWDASEYARCDVTIRDAAPD